MTAARAVAGIRDASAAAPPALLAEDVHKRFGALES